MQEAFFIIYIITLYDNENEEEIFIKLRMSGVISLFNIRKPTEEELKNCKYFIATSHKEWIPYSTDFAENEELNEAELSSVNTKVTRDLHCEWLHALNHRNISDISISADQRLLDRIVNKGIANDSDFNYLSDSSSGDGYER